MKKLVIPKINSIQFGVRRSWERDLKETIPFDIEKDNSVTVDWNGEKALVYDKCVYLSNPHFSYILPTGF